MASKLSHDILIEILKRLPVKTLIRFKCVSKEWSSLISSDEFVNHHLNFNINNQHTEKCYILNTSASSNDETYFTLYDETMTRKNALDFPFKKNFGYLSIIGACNGILCLAEFSEEAYGDVVYLWNPSIKRVKILRDSVVSGPLSGFSSPRVGFGFGYDELNSDFKVVRIFYFKDSVFDDPVVEVYSLNKDSWHMLDAKFPRVTLGYHNPCVYLNGAIHWAPLMDNIIVLNLSNEEVNEIEKPYCLDGVTKFLDVDIWVYKGMLAMISYHDLDEDATNYHVWVMKEYGVVDSWTKLFTVHGQIIDRVFCFGWRDEIILQMEDNITSYTLETNVRKDHGSVRPYDIVRYEESSALLDKGKDVSEYIRSFKGVTYNGIRVMIKEVVEEQDKLKPVEGVVYDGIDILIKDEADTVNNA